MASRIDRELKNLMRSQLEEILQVYRKLEEQIENFEMQTEPEEYRRFWRELQDENCQRIQRLSRYMVTKCNR